MVDSVGSTGLRHDSTRTEVGKAIMKVPMLAVTMTGNLFKLKGANKKFIHTEHGEHHSHS